MNDSVGNGNYSGNRSKKGFLNIDKFGENIDIDTASTPEAIFTVGGQFPFLDTGIPMDLISTLATDDISGVGAQKIEVTIYHTDNSKEIKIIDMNGVGRAQVDDDIKIGTRLRVSQSGSSNTNLGTVKLVDRATGLIVYQQVEVEEGSTLSAVQIVEKDKTGIIKSHYATYARVQNLNAAQLRLKVRLIDGTIQTRYNITISADHPRDDQDYGDDSDIMIDEGQYVYWECLAVTANDTPIEAGFKLEIWDK